MKKNQKSPYEILKNRHYTEKSSVLANLQNAEGNPSVKKCQSPKVVFIVDPNANKQEIAWAIEVAYADKKVKVTKVNIVNMKPKSRRVRGHLGKTSARKKAVITLAAGDSIDDQV